MNRNRSPRLVTALVTGAAAIVALGLTAVAPMVLRHGAWSSLPSRVATLIQAEVFFTTLNLLLLVALAGVYVTLHRDLSNKYTLSLVLLSLALLLYAFTSNPVVHLVFGFRPRPNVGPFVFIPDLFVGVAIVVLLYQSQT